MDSHSCNTSDLLIIALAGYARSGKDTAADMLFKYLDSALADKYGVKQYSIKKYRFADPIKDATAESLKYFIDESYHEDMSHTSVAVNTSVLHSVIDEYKNANSELAGINVRKAQQQIGSVFRNMNNNFFVDAMISRIKKDVETATKFFSSPVLQKRNHVTIIIIPDTRFVNEEKLLREEFGECYNLIRVDKPDIIAKAEAGEPPYNHESEKQIRMLNPDKVIMNDGSLDDLKLKVKNYIAKQLFFKGVLDETAI